MIHKELHFKNVGRFADEGSSRYECVIDNLFKIIIFKDEYYWKGFVFEFWCINNKVLSKVTNDCRSNLWSKATKKEIVQYVTGIINDSEIFETIKTELNYQ